MHKLLQRQLLRCVAGTLPTEEEWKLFLKAIHEAYEQSDADRKLLERSLELNSQELLEINENLRKDVSRRRAAELELQSSLAILRATLEATQDGILVVDLQGKIQNHNSRFAEMWNIPESILLPRSVERVE